MEEAHLQPWVGGRHLENIKKSRAELENTNTSYVNNKEFSLASFCKNILVCLLLHIFPVIIFHMYHNRSLISGLKTSNDICCVVEVLKSDYVVRLPTLRERVRRERPSIITSRVTTVETKEKKHVTVCACMCEQI